MRKQVEAKPVAKASALETYLKTYWKPYAKDNIVSHKDIERRLKRNVGDRYARPMADIYETDIERWRRSQAKAIRPTTLETLQLELTHLKTAFTVAVRE